MASRSRGAARNRRGDRDADTPEQLGDDAENTMGALRTSEDQDGLRTSEDQDGLVDTLEGDFHDASGIIIDEENEDGKNGEEGATNSLNVGQSSVMVTRSASRVLWEKGKMLYDKVTYLFLSL